jgi:XTP/dITP diphosphohydrolase
MGLDLTQKLTPGTKLVVASHNKGKVWEIHQLLAPYGLDAISAGELNLAEPDETEPTFEGNAKLKAVAAATGSGLPALADDSGLEVECLGGAPGIYSARWAGPGKDFGLAMKKVSEEVTARNAWPAPGMYGLGPRANFISVLCLAWPDGDAQFFEGKVFGHLVWPPRGGNGFGYDPMFVPDGDMRTYGEMPPAEKYAGSHRTRAFAAFKSQSLDHIKAAPDTGKIAGRDLAALTAAAASLSTREELAQFVMRLRADLHANRGAWTSETLDTYFAAMQGCLSDMPESDDPKWRTMAKVLLAASLYE